jgi:L-threonylcarbamoyladenylate synthase
MNNSVNDEINQAVLKLNAGDVVAIPTETVYGLAARIDMPEAINKIFSTKQRPFFDPLIVHVTSIGQAKLCVSEWPEAAEILAHKFWPGPLTLVLPKSDKISDLITSGLTRVGIRWPSHPVAQQIIEQVGVPLAAPSANKFGRTSPTRAEHVRDEFAENVFVINSQPSEIGIESTVLLINEENKTGKVQLSILRAGAVLKSQIEKELIKTNLNWEWNEVIDKKESPGHMKHHYMPSVPLVICKNPQIKISELTNLLNEKLKELPDEVEGVKLVKPNGPIKKIEFLNLSENPEQAARELYAQLRSVSSRKPDAICFIQSSKQNDEMWRSIFDRLYKAASLVLD